MQKNLHEEFRLRCANSSGCVPYGVTRGEITVRTRPAEISAASGCVLRSEEGHEYLDFSNSFGSVVLGHADPVVEAAVLEAVRAGIPAGLGYAVAVEVAERLARDLQQPYRVAVFNTGTVAVRACVLAAQKATGRSRIVSAGFHGWDLMWESATTAFGFSAHGICDFLYSPEALERILIKHASEVAAVVPSPDYLHCTGRTLRSIAEITRRFALFFIADEVKYGYRYNCGPSMGRLGIEADVYVYAKGLANGWPVACAIGQDQLLDEMTTYVSTLTYAYPALVAAKATLQRAEEIGARDSIAREAGRFVSAVREMLAAAALPLAIAGDGSSFQFVAETPELEAALLQTAYAERLVFQPGDQQLPSYAMRGEMVDRAVAAMEKVVDQLASEFAHLRGMELTERAWLEAAWSQMDGLSDRPVAPELRQEFLQSKYATGE